jgi:hypothetical protein
MGGGAGVKWQHELVRDMLKLAKMYLEIPAVKNKETGTVLEQAASAILQQDRKISKMEEALKRIRDCDWVITLPDRMDAVRAIAREALE